MILWPGGTGPNPAPPQLLFLCWGPGCSLRLSLTCSMALPLPCVPTRPGLGFFFTSGMLVWGILACRMCADSMCAEAAQKARLPHLRHRSVALVCEGTGELPHFSACLPAPQSLPKPLLPFHPLEKDLYPWHAALHWVTSLLLRVPTLPGLAGFSGSRFAGGSEAG